MGYYKDNYFKMRVTPEEFRAVESAVVECGGVWQSGDKKAIGTAEIIYSERLIMTLSIEGLTEKEYTIHPAIHVNPQEFIEGLRAEHNAGDIKLKFSGTRLKRIASLASFSGPAEDWARDEMDARAYAQAACQRKKEERACFLEILEELTEPEETDLELLEKIELSQDMAMYEAGEYVPCTQQEYRHRTRFMFLDYDEDKKDYVFKHEYTERLLELE